VAAIAADPAPATFDNTIVALERSGQLLQRVDRCLFQSRRRKHQSDDAADSNARMAPKLSAQRERHPVERCAFSARIQRLYDDRAQLGLDAESNRLVERYTRISCGPARNCLRPTRRKLRAMNAELATLQTRFSQNVLKRPMRRPGHRRAARSWPECPPARLPATQAAARAEHKDGSSSSACSTPAGSRPGFSLENRALRERLQKTSVGRCSHGGEFDNRDVVLRITALRAQRAALLGYASHAAYVLEDQTAHTPAAVNELLARLAPPAVANGTPRSRGHSGHH